MEEKNIAEKNIESNIESNIEGITGNTEENKYYNVYSQNSYNPQNYNYEESDFMNNDYMAEQDRIRESNLADFYNSPYYQSLQRKKQNRKSFIALLCIIAAIYIMFIGLGGSLLEQKEEKAAEYGTNLEEKIEEKYGVVVNVGDDINVMISKYQIEQVDNSTQTYEALKAIDVVLSRLPKEFIDEIAQKDEGKYLEINVTGDMYNLEGTKVEGVASRVEKMNIIRIDATAGVYADLQVIFAHEVFHIIDYDMMEESGYLSDIQDWEMYNPPAFTYGESEGYYNTYLIESSGLGNTYFVTAYSKTEIYEDRAETYSYLLGTDEDEKLPNSYSSRYIDAKCRLLINEIKEHYGSVIAGDMYIERWFN
jgi:hypothetical protein